MMDQNLQRERDHTIDLESGGSSTSEEDGSNNHVPRIRQVQNLFGRVWSGVASLDGSIKGEDGISSSYHRITGSAEFTFENAESMVDKKCEGEEKEALLEQKVVKEKRKKTSPKRPPKPPRPPRGPSLDAADQKMIKEISELVLLKRARNERMKAMKKAKAAKGSSPNAGLFAMIVTILFCLLFILFPGRSSSHKSFPGSPEPSLMSGRLISVQYYKNISVGSIDGAGSSSPNYIEQVSKSGSSTQMK